MANKNTTLGKYTKTPKQVNYSARKTEPSVGCRAYENRTSQEHGIYTPRPSCPYSQIDLRTCGSSSETVSEATVKELLKTYTGCTREFPSQGLIYQLLKNSKQCLLMRPGDRRDQATRPHVHLPLPSSASPAFFSPRIRLPLSLTPACQTFTTQGQKQAIRKISGLVESLVASQPKERSRKFLHLKRRGNRGEALVAEGLLYTCLCDMLPCYGRPRSSTSNLCFHFRNRSTQT